MAHQQPASERPTFTPGYGIVQSPEGMLGWPWAVERLEQARNYWVCTAGRDGRPHAAPVWGLWLAGAFWFSSDPMSRKGRNLGHGGEIAVHLESGDEVVVIEGVVERVTRADLYTAFADGYEAKYALRPEPDNPAGAIYRVAPRIVLAWREADFATSATRWTFEG